MGRATIVVNPALLPAEFQSTPSVGRATSEEALRRYKEGISIHALRGEGDEVEEISRPSRGISIHALRGEGDYESPRNQRRVLNFNPRPPWGGRPQCQKH